MAMALEHVGEHLWALPDGEIGERTEACPGGTRSAWVQTIMDRCEADTDNWTVVRPARRNAGGYAADYESGPRLKPKRRPRDIADHLDFGWAAAARQSHPEFLRLRREFGFDELKFQVGLPTGLGATSSLSPIVYRGRRSGSRPTVSSAWSARSMVAHRLVCTCASET